MSALLAGSALAQQAASADDNDKTIFGTTNVQYTASVPVAAPGLRDKFGSFLHSGPAVPISQVSIDGNPSVVGGQGPAVNGQATTSGQSVINLTGGVGYTPLGQLTAWVGDIVYPLAIGGIAVFAFYIFLQLAFSVRTTLA